MADRKPFVGALVHRHYVGGCQAAIVTRINTDGTVDINGFGPTGAVPFVRLSQGGEPGHWHWPEEETP